MKYIAIVGNVFKGCVTFHGPFEDEEAANKWCGIESLGQPFHVVPLRSIAWSQLAVDHAKEQRKQKARTWAIGDRFTRGGETYEITECYGMSFETQRVCPLSDKPMGERFNMILDEHERVG